MITIGSINFIDKTVMLFKILRLIKTNRTWINISRKRWSYLWTLIIKILVKTFSYPHRDLINRTAKLFSVNTNFKFTEQRRSFISVKHRHQICLRVIRRIFMRRMPKSFSKKPSNSIDILTCTLHLSYFLRWNVAYIHDHQDN